MSLVLTPPHQIRMAPTAGCREAPVKRDTHPVVRAVFSPLIYSVSQSLAMAKNNPYRFALVVPRRWHTHMLSVLLLFFTPHALRVIHHID